MFAIFCPFQRVLKGKEKFRSCQVSIKTKSFEMFTNQSNLNYQANIIDPWVVTWQYVY